MIDDLRLILTVISAIGCGLVGGVFFAFSTFVMSALRRLPPGKGIAAMQAINVAVINPLFLGPFLGTAATCVAVAAWSLVTWDRPGSTCALIGGLLYPVGTFGVTMVFNVPRNDALAAVGPDSAEGASLWGDYVSGWTKWNHVRTAAALAAAVLLTIAVHRSA